MDSQSRDVEEWTCCVCCKGNFISFCMYNFLLSLNYLLNVLKSAVPLMIPIFDLQFLGCTEVDKPKGIEVVKQGIQKLKFNQQLKKSEGSKTPKAELTISVEGVAIQEPKTKKILHQYPLHKISYCADDKAEQRFFSFISKDGDGKHTCFVFVSDKLVREYFCQLQVVSSLKD